MHQAPDRDAVPDRASEPQVRPAQANSERRSIPDRRRSSRGLFELRARRDGLTDDRRSEGRGRRWLQALQRSAWFSWLFRTSHPDS